MTEHYVERWHGQLDILPSIATIERLLRDLIALNGLKLIAGPFVVPHEGTITGIAIMAESHCAIEVRADLSGHATVDSCLAINSSGCQALLASALGGRWETCSSNTEVVAGSL